MSGTAVSSGLMASAGSSESAASSGQVASAGSSESIQQVSVTAASSGLRANVGSSELIQQVNVNPEYENDLNHVGQSFENNKQQHTCNTAAANSDEQLMDEATFSLKLFESSVGEGGGGGGLFNGCRLSAADP